MDPILNDYINRNTYDSDYPWFWVDLETTGLEPETNLILEIVVVVTDRNLNEIDSMRLVLNHPHHVLIARSSTWCKRKFCSTSKGGNGLFDACHFSSLSHHEAEHRLWNFFDHYSKDPSRRNNVHGLTSSQPFFERTLGANGAFIGGDINHGPHRTGRNRSNYKKCMLAGSTVYFDRLFLLKYFPCMKTFFHYRLIDVSTPLEMVRRWRPDIAAKLPRRTGSHRAYDDILESISLMKFFRETLLM